MTKQQIIDTIKAAEGSAWLEIARYNLSNKPICTTWAQEKSFIENDSGHVKRVSEWYSLSQLMESLNIATDFDDAHREASDINAKVWMREQNAKGIYYDEKGNRIA